MYFDYLIKFNGKVPKDLEIYDAMLKRTKIPIDMLNAFDITKLAEKKSNAIFSNPKNADFFLSFKYDFSYRSVTIEYLYCEGQYNKSILSVTALNGRTHFFYLLGSILNCLVNLGGEYEGEDIPEWCRLPYEEAMKHPHFIS